MKVRINGEEGVREGYFAVGVITAPRPNPTLTETLRELRRAGFSGPIQVFAEPGCDVPESSNVRVRANRVRLGLWPNWLRAASCLLSSTEAPFLLLCEDDLCLCPAAAESLYEATHTLPPDTWGYASLYTPWHNLSGQLRDSGWHALDMGGDSWGALAYCFSRESLRAVLAHPTINAWSSSEGTDGLISGVLRLLDRRCYFHVPSLCEHTGANNSSVGHHTMPEMLAVDFSPVRRHEELPAAAMVQQDRRREPIDASSSASFAAKVMKRPLKVGFLTPCLLVGGVEQWLCTLAKYSDKGRISWQVGLTEPANLAPSIAATLRSHARLSVGRSAVGEVTSTSDIILAWGLVDLAELLKDVYKPIVVVAHGICTWTGEFMRLSRGVATHFAAVSQVAATSFPDAHVHVISNGIDPDRCQAVRSRECVRREWGLMPDEIAVGYVGRLSEEKNCGAVSRAVLALGAPYRAVYVGPKTSMGVVEEIRRLTPDAIIVEPMEQVGDAFAALDAMVSVSPAEGASLVVLEAMLAGVPIVTTPVGLIPEIQQRHGDVLVTVLNYPTTLELAEGVKRALSPQHRPQLPVAQRIVRNHYTAARMAADWTEYLEEVFACRSAATLLSRT